MTVTAVKYLKKKLLFNKCCMIDRVHERLSSLIETEGVMKFKQV